MIDLTKYGEIYCRGIHRNQYLKISLRQEVSGGVRWQLPDHVFDSLDPNMELQVVSIIHEQASEM